MIQRMFAATRSALPAAISLLSLLVGLTLGCGEAKRCEPGLCPSGTVCDAQSGTCAPNAGSHGGKAPAIFGTYTAVALPGLHQGYVAYVPDQRSLAYVERGPATLRTVFIAGPAVDPAQPAAGEVATAVAAPDGRLHVAYLSGSPPALFYATRAQGAWQRERIEVVAEGRAAGGLAIALAHGSPVLAFLDAQTNGFGVVRRSDAIWKAEFVSAGLIGDEARALEGPLALSASGASLAIAAYDRVGGDLLVATRGSLAWQVVVLAGRNPTTGADEGEAGRPCALLRGLSGDLVVVYRHAGRNEVRVARSTGGPPVHTQVTDGSYSDDTLGVTRTRLVGTDLAVAALPSGRLVIAWQDASRARIGMALETAAGAFTPLKTPDAGRPQLRPRLLAQLDGSVVASWIEPDPKANPPAGRLVTWTLPSAGAR